MGQIAYWAAPMKISIPIPWRSMEVHVMKVPVEEDSLRTKANNALDIAQDWAQKRILKPIGEFVDTVNGQKALVEVIDQHDVAAVVVELRIANIAASAETDSPGNAPPPLILNV
jgi:hypothetical protein